MRYTFKTKFNVFLTGTLAVFMASCNPLGELTRTDDSYCFNAPNSVNGVCIDTDDTTQTITVDQTDDDNSATGFGGGSHTGTAYSSGVLTLNTTTNNAELDESWTPQWNNLVAYWKMDETNWNGTANEVIDSKGTNHGVRVGDATTTSSAKIGSYAGTFDGSNDEVSITENELNNYDWNNDFSVSFWIKSDPTHDIPGRTYASPIYFSCSSGYMLQTLLMDSADGSAGQFRFFRYNGTSVASAQTSIGFLNDATFKHIVLIKDGSEIKLYINNNLIDTGTDVSTIASSCSGLTIGGNDFKGDLDDIGFWNTALTADEIGLIYSRQSAKYTGEMKSRIMDSQNTNSSWTNIDWITPLPFGKELPDGGGAANSESSADYSDLYSDSLMDGLVGLWHLNSNSWTDSSGLSYDGASGGNVSISNFGLFSNAAEFDGDKDYVELPASSTILPGDTSLTLSAWFKTSLTYDTTIVKNANHGGRLFSVYRTDAPASYSSKIGLGFYGDDTDTLFIFHNPANSALTYTNSGFNDGKWHHLLCTYDATSDELKLYYDGIEVASANSITLSDSGTNLMHIGDFDSADTEGSFNGLIDEAGVWNRALDSTEVLQLYRRGANRIKYQVRSCTSADCSDQDAATGDGWRGPGGNYLTYFSELYNNSSISSNCVIPQACFGSELSLDGDVQTESPSIRFDDFGADGIYMNNARYFQYRVIMESDDENTACAGGTTCMPELKSVEIGPAHTFEQ